MWHQIERILEIKAARQQAELAKAAEKLTALYHEAVESPALSDIEQLAYALVRMPATFQVNTVVLQELVRNIPNFAPQNCLDIGSGPGTASLAAAQQFDSIEQFSCLEKQNGFIKLGRELRSNLSLALQRTDWIQGNTRKVAKFSHHDLTIASYVLSELSEQFQVELAESVLEKSSVVVFIEPGTPKGFSNIIRVRSRLIRQGAYILAPCPHKSACPLMDPDWCHFSTRLQRTELHKRVKQASLPYEDEKYSYLIASRTPPEKPYAARVIKKPLVRSGHVHLDVCTAQGEQRVTATKSHERYREFKKLEWGDLVYDLRPMGRGEPER